MSETKAERDARGYRNRMFPQDGYEAAPQENKTMNDPDLITQEYLMQIDKEALINVMLIALDYATHHRGQKNISECLQLVLVRDGKLQTIEEINENYVE